MAETDWTAFTDQTNRRMAELRKAMPKPAKGFGALAQAAIAPGVLDSRLSRKGGEEAWRHPRRGHRDDRGRALYGWWPVDDLRRRSAVLLRRPGRLTGC